jgi:polysaccharide biosynthesis protein PslH
LRILRICQDVPFPPDDGVRIDPFHSSLGLAARGHEVTIVGFLRGDRDVSPMRDWCNLHVVPFDGKNSTWNLVCGALERRPVNYVKYRSTKMLSLCHEVLAEKPFDVVVVDYSAMGWYAFDLKRQSNLPVITRWHNVDTVIWKRWMVTQDNPVRRKLGQVQFDFVRRFEQELASISDCCLTVGARDTELLQEMVPTARVELVPPGIDVKHYTPNEAMSEPYSIVLLSSDYGWHPNYDAAKWLYEEIMPLVWKRIPHARLYLTGRNVTPDMKAWTKTGLVEFTGFVPDERTVIGKAAVMVVPMRLGGGVKLKVLTAFACGKAVVTTSAGAEGIPGLVKGDRALVRDDSAAFADAVVQVMLDRDLRLRLGQAGRDLVCQKYSWDAVVDQWENVLHSVAEPRMAAVV